MASGETQILNSNSKTGVQDPRSQGGLCPSMHHRSYDKGVSIQGVSVRGGLCQGDPPDRDPPYSNERVVHILLECILVFEVIFKIIDVVYPSLIFISECHVEKAMALVQKLPSPWSGSLQGAAMTFSRDRTSLVHINEQGVNVTPQQLGNLSLFRNCTRPPEVFRIHKKS